ncbi:hypothetical protein AZE42_00081 [Rhizopogon vesiculosus]|uniref:Uncharacterized protein n=1 Tax=Rhizopogon vesiculosus TaxID=180088 RepID=A0A1J8QWX0_9AGAM|nr:hypothetical protein AZE42_00081 [Rhizopogon vesiculosus]
MADIETIPHTPDIEDTADFVDLGDGTSTETHGEHEAAGVVDPEPVPQDDTPAYDAVHDDAINTIITQEDTQPADTPGDAAPVTKPEVTKKLNPTAAVTASKDKLVISAKAKGAPTKSGPPTPTVKKVLNSGAFGSGVTKPAPGNKSPAATPTLSKTTTSAPSTLRKSISTSTNQPAKPASTMASSRSPPPPPARRQSMLPPRAPSATGTPPTPKPRGTLLSSLASSMSSKPASTEANSGAARPRASISEAVRRTPSSSSTKGSPSNAPPPRPIRQPSSISSIREVRDDGKPLEEMQQKLKEALNELSEKAAAVATLEARLAEVSASLESTNADARAKQASIVQMQLGKDAAEAELKTFKATLQQVRNEHSQDRALLESVKQELHAAKLASLAQTDAVHDLQSQLESLTAEMEAARDNLETLRTSSEQSSSAAAEAAQTEREALLRARTDLETITAEAEALTASHASTLQGLHATLSEAQARAADTDALEAQVQQLKAEREDNANKLSELEVEILELKESQEQAEDEHAQVLDRLQTLEEELADAAAATQNALDASKVREVQHAQLTDEMEEAHNGELQAAKNELSKIVADLEGLRDDLAAAHAAHEQTRLEAQSAAEEHERQLDETEGEFLSKHLELSEEIKRINAELEASCYLTSPIIFSHEFCRVKKRTTMHGLTLSGPSTNSSCKRHLRMRRHNEAGDAHGQDLVALRAESQATIEQLRAAHQSTVDGLKADYEDVLASQAGELEKRLSNQSLELRATQDDLAKAKAALDSSRTETESLKAQLEDARTAFAAASASPDQASEIDRLTRELANFRDENAMLNDVLAVTKESLSEMSSNHTKELEDTARGRVEDVIKLRAAHEEEISALALQKSELSLQLSDMEGEVATLRAQVAAATEAAAAAPKSNGAVPPSSTMVTREELQKVHEAHNMKMHDMVTDHERTVRGLRGEIDGLQSKLDELHQDISRKSMEIQYLEQEQDESQDSIIRLKADLEQLKGTSDV